MEGSNKTVGKAYLCWLLGWFGMLGFHHFYLGNIGKGILYIFTAGGLFFFGSLPDLFKMRRFVEEANARIEAKEFRKMAKALERSKESSTQTPTHEWLKENLGYNELLRSFRQTFTETQGERHRPEITTLDSGSISRYSQPSLPKSVERKINDLHEVTHSIEKNLVIAKDVESSQSDFKIDYKNELNPAQFLAVTITNDPLLVIAGAGSGKTRTIVYRVAHLIENGIPPEQILLLTFTRKAANEMMTRASTLLNDIRCSQITGGTFHSFANHMLRRYSGLIGISPDFTIADTVDSEDIINLVRKEMHFEKRSRAFPRKRRIQEIISKSRNCNTTVNQIIKREFTGLSEFIEDIELIFVAFTEFKRANHIFDFDDLMEVFRDSLKQNEQFKEKIQNRFRYIMVDEFQDTNLMQKQIADGIAEKHQNIMVVGDDSQSIYAFRGANFENILRFPETYPDCKYVKIEQNYRSSQHILDFTNAVINNAQIGYKKRLFSTKKTGGKPKVKHFYEKEDEAEFVVKRILDLREKGIPLNEIAVLYRATSHSIFIQAELLRRKIPYEVFGGIRFIERRHVKDIIAYLRIILNPFDAVSWNRVLKLIPGIGNVTASKIVKHLHSMDGEIDFKDFEMRKYSQDLQKLARALNQAEGKEVSIPNKIEILKEYYFPILQSLESDYDIRLRDIDTLNELACKYEDLEKFLSDFALDPPSNRFQNGTTPEIDEREDKSVILSTVHSAKGLEWHTVFIPHLLDGLFPMARCMEDIEELEQERRLFYVACTRAKENLYLTMPAYSSTWDAYFTLPSRFLMEVDKRKYRILE